MEVDSPSLPKVEEATEQDEEEREKFLNTLKQFHLERGTPMTRPPVLSQRTLDLYRLYQLVQEYGGMEKVSDDGVASLRYWLCQQQIQWAKIF